MPVYEYQCTACKREFEYEHRMSDPSRTVCEACGGALERLISRTSFAFKGGGWYKDLYASAKPSSDSGGAASPAPAAPSGDSGGSAGATAPSAGSASGGSSGSSGSAGSGGSSGSGSSGGSGSAASS